MAEPTTPDDATLDALDADAALEEVIAAYIQARERGQPVDLPALMAAFPDLAPELEAFVANYAAVHDILGHDAPGDAPADAPGRLGAYDLLGELARGGMGVVYRARHADLDREVALKMLLSGRFADQETRARFRVEAQAAASLRHPHIVPVYEVGEEDGRAYFTMPLIAGGTLATDMDRWAADRRAAVALMAKVARAIQHAHEHGILHRDIKPGNILIDERGEPFITDFGLAGHTGTSARLTRTGTIIGTAGYMAPEQASGEPVPLSVATDVHGLGAVLYELLTGRPPFVGASFWDTLRQVREDLPPDPRVVAGASVDADLAAICMKCLSKAPAHRYPSAADLARDLERWLAGEPVRAQPLGRAQRLWRWSRRHPERAALGILLPALLAALLLAAALHLGSLEQRRAEARVRAESMLEGNRYAARLAAQAVRHRLDALSRPVARVATRPDMADLVRRRDLPAVHAALADADAAVQATLGHSPYASWFVLDRDGDILARRPEPIAAGPDTNFSTRSYFAAVRARDDAYVSRIYRATADDLYKFGIAAPIVHDDAVAGVVVATIATGPSMGMPEIEGERERTAALVAPMDPSSATAGDRADYRVFLHPAYRPGDAPAALDPATAERIQASASGHVRAYRDPVDPAGHDPWLLGFARVPDTSFAVLIQQRYQGEREARDALARAWRAWLMAFAFALLLAALGAARYLRRRRRS